MSELINAIRQAVIGEKTAIRTPFGLKPLVYADYTASGRALSLIEDTIQHGVLPYYANTHTETSFTGAQTTRLREQARQQIRSAVNGTEDDQVIFCGPGATAAIHKLIDILNLRLPADLNDRYALLDQIPEDERPVVLIGPYEHHSNELPWRESIAEVISIPLTGCGQLDMKTLEQALQRVQQRKLVIGSFSAASNVTGIKTDVTAVSSLLHRYGALSFWDYAAAGPYVGIDMSDKDAIFLSPHKFIGGPGTPGVLVAKRKLFCNRVPAVPGGGTVMYVTPEDHRFIDNPERREEGGTPAIVESIRAGLVFRLQQQVGTDFIEKREADFVERAVARWSQHDNIDILGAIDVPRLSITSLRIRHGEKDLHYGFVVALLNDLFGIQARGGCSCAGPYGHSLLGMDMTYSKALEEQLLAGHMVLRPGWTRLNFNYFIDESTFDYLVSAVELVAEHGWRLLPYYQFDPKANIWRYQGQPMNLPSSLVDVDFTRRTIQAPDTCETPLSTCLEQGREQLLADRSNATTYELILADEPERLRWFVRPQDVQR
ncbi:aminotransferase class V-fold PLP-dependent enzyme [Aestuariicella sp. G3-2]|uniref:aminotransferase class V-fold PLP-dependent enzyme n=1 Tax=Pseudomaricurvus albidus TaxID=2842452 RepID=UPI001C0DD5C1|nr:aminotransferase class V-fold PLP-dependent enzyme [Aestuariicella albida]MBU3070936.1 aminotransferase class V-fold PLP-dependent enzyme [Aestuariicella albida]